MTRPASEYELFEQQTFEKIDFTRRKPVRGSYENCTFLHCNFEKADLSGFNFLECTFSHCNLSLANIADATIKETVFNESKLLGIVFEKCNAALFSADFEKSDLSMSSFIKLKLKKIRFKGCNLRDTDFAYADLSAAVFDGCDLAGAKFDRTILEKADLRTSYHFSIDPEANRIRKAKFSMQGALDLLTKYDIEID
ncbi:pentapeptide repeat-containing protein [bacterium]|nr:pentapeptide repeat-containing protein [bacterium]